MPWCSLHCCSVNQKPLTRGVVVFHTRDKLHLCVEIDISARAVMNLSLCNYILRCFISSLQISQFVPFFRSEFASKPPKHKWQKKRYCRSLVSVHNEVMFAPL